MTRERLYLYDTTLRDGAQTQGVDFSAEDKRTIALALDTLGIDYVEGGWPGANPTDDAFFAAAPALDRARLTAFGMTRRPGRSADNDPGLKALTDVSAAAVTLVAKTWDYHVDLALEISNDENLDLIADSIRHVAGTGAEAVLAAEHFFDGYLANPDFALACLGAAMEAGARWVVLCDTNGGTLPDTVERIVGEVAAIIPGDRLGIHAHNDTENAVANSLAAVRAGARHIQGTINGLGERCGNANLVSLIPNLMLKPPYAEQFETGITANGLRQLTRIVHLVDELLNRSPDRQAPYVGASAFAHKGGLHVSAIQKDPYTYEHVDPAAVGNERQVLVSNQSGRANILARCEALGVEIAPNHPAVASLLENVKRREHYGYAYEGADASFELLARRELGQVPDYFSVDHYRVIVERRINALGRELTIAEATVKITVDDERLLSVAEGNGPVNALDGALRKDLGHYSAYLEELQLVDYKVRILTGGTEAVTRVLIESADDTGARWFTVGVSPNIVDASFQALHDSIVYKLYRDGAPTPREAAPI
jgi:2-isopropylmalate synthase